MSMTAVRHLLVYENIKLFFDEIAFKNSAEIRQVSLAKGGYYTRIAGENQRKIIISGKLFYTDKTIFREFVEAVSGKSVSITVDSIPYENIGLEESSLEFGADSNLGKFKIILRRGLSG